MSKARIPKCILVLDPSFRYRAMLVMEPEKMALEYDDDEADLPWHSGQFEEDEAFDPVI